MRRLLVGLLALSLPPSTRLPAQSPEDRAAVAALRDSLAGVTDSLSLRHLEAATIQVAKQQRDDPLIHCRLGFIAYRLGELTNAKSHYDDAAGEFEWAGELRPDWPYAWYGLGLAELAQGEHAVIAIENLRQQLGKDYLTKAARALARAAQADPSFAQASIDLANTALTQRIQPRLEVALQAVRLTAASAAGRNAGVQLARGRVEREVGDADSAVAGFQAYLRVGGDSGLGLLELARTHYYAQRPADGWRTYFAGARLARSPEAVELYRADLSVVAGPDELAPFDGFTSPGPRAAWLERFWLRRDITEAREPGERLAEHYRRWFYARHNFRLVSRHRHYDITEVYRPNQAEFDDRGMIYIRHGEPDRRARFLCREPEEPNGEGCAANESWLYRRREGDLVFHFVARGDVQDYKLVESRADRGDQPHRQRWRDAARGVCHPRRAPQSRSGSRRRALCAAVPPNGVGLERPPRRPRGHTACLRRPSGTAQSLVSHGPARRAARARTVSLPSARHERRCQRRRPRDRWTARRESRSPPLCGERRRRRPSGVGSRVGILAERHDLAESLESFSRRQRRGVVLRSLRTRERRAVSHGRAARKGRRAFVIRCDSRSVRRRALAGVARIRRTRGRPGDTRASRNCIARRRGRQLPAHRRSHRSRQRRERHALPTIRSRRALNC